jgi:glycosyltransferase involved in cell wall biosynthesis
MNSHICHIISNLTIGGAEQYVVQLSNYLHSTGRRVSIVAGEPHTLAQRLNGDIHVETLQMHPGASRSLLVYLRMLPPVIRHLVAYFRREQVATVHTHLTASAWPAWIAAKICGIPVIHSKMYTAAHGSRLERVLFATRLPLVLVDRFLAFTHYIEDEIVKYWHASRSHVVVSSIGVDTARFTLDAKTTAASRAEFGFAADDRVMLVVARLHSDKDVDLAIRAARILDDPKAVLVIGGDGPQREYLENLAATLPGRTAIRFLGALQNPAPAYAAANVLLQTTRGPNLGVVVLEAMASGLPVLIAYRDEEEYKMALDTFDGRDIGALAKATPDEMAAKAKELFNEPEKLENWRHEVRRFVENRHSQTFAYAEMADHYSAIERSGR